MSTQPTTLIKNVRIVNEGAITPADILLSGGRIERIDSTISAAADRVLDGREGLLLPGMIDDQVHFREPGLTHKGTIASESRAAVAGGITSFMEMPNTDPKTATQELLQQKYDRGAADSRANYSFYMGATNDNLDEVLRTDASKVCGVKVFMGSSTGNMLVDREEALNALFSQVPLLIATHCEKEEIVRANLVEFHSRYGERLGPEHHPAIRSREACLASSTLAVELARKHGTRLHVLHISTKEELELFRSELTLAEKRITSEACVHHLWFSSADYATLGSRIRWNPAVKDATDRAAIQQAVRDGTIDVIATDHAPHTIEEKSRALYAEIPSGAPLVQHALTALLELCRQGTLDLTTVVQRTAHNPAILFGIERRGFIREGYQADLVLVDLDSPWRVSRENIAYHCGWSPFEGMEFNARIRETFVNGASAYREGAWDESVRGMRLTFNR
jgi:dihydroorotase